MRDAQSVEYKDFLVEIGTEELPPKALSALSAAFTQSIIQQAEAAGLSFSAKQVFATPRRLGLLLKDLSASQPDKPVQRKGPAMQAAFKEGEPTKALLGFARSCGVDIDVLDTLETEKGAWLVYRTTEKGKLAEQLLPSMVKTALNTLPIPKRMRWGIHRDEFVRPVHWLVMLLGESVIDCNLLGLKSGRETFGHRIHSHGALTVNRPSEYESILETEGKVIADFSRRQQLIRTQAEAAVTANARVMIDPLLLNEVTGLVEWPVAITGDFDKAFLSVPKEALISSMQEHQKYFPVIDKAGNLLPHFVCIANLESKDMAQVIAGNERVIRPRLADAQFFFETDKKTTLKSKREKLKHIIFQKKLGTVFDKTERVAKLAQFIIWHLFPEGQAMDDVISKKVQQVNNAAFLSKSDLVSEMVLEFPELQGLMGRYYAEHEEMDQEVCLALEEQYFPRFSGDKLPSTNVGCALAIAEKLDTLVGIFGIGQPPSGNKDPFALRRATLGILRIIIEKQLPLQLNQLICKAQNIFSDQGVQLTVIDTEKQVTDFMFDRLRSLSQGEGIPAETFLAVKAVKPMNPCDFYRRMDAVEAFRRFPEAEALAQANKRVANILAKTCEMKVPEKVDTSLLQEPAEKQLYKALVNKENEIAPYTDYKVKLALLATLKESVDDFFDQVLVNTENTEVKANRYALLKKLQVMFQQVADIALI